MSETVLSLQYETQHFGFHPHSFLDEVYNVFFESVTSSLNQLRQFLIQEFHTIEPINVIQAETHNILQKFYKLCDKAVDKLELYLIDNVFAFEQHVILPEDEIHIKSPCTKEEDEKLDQELEELKQKVLAEKAKKYLLKKQIAAQKKVKEHLLHFQIELKQLLNVASQKGITEENIESFHGDLKKLIEESCSLF